MVRMALATLSLSGVSAMKRQLQYCCRYFCIFGATGGYVDARGSRGERALLRGHESSGYGAEGHDYPSVGPRERYEVEYFRVASLSRLRPYS